MARHKPIKVYIEHGKTILHAYLMSPHPSEVSIKEIFDQLLCSRSLFLEWKEPKIRDCSGLNKPEVKSTKETQSA